MTTNGHATHPGVGLVEPAHIIPAPPPAPTAADAQRAYAGVTVAPPTVAQAAPQPVMPTQPPVVEPVAQAQQAPVAAPAPRQPGRVGAWLGANPRRPYLLGLGLVLAIPAGLWIHGRTTGPDVDPNLAALQYTVTSLQEDLKRARTAADVEVNPLSNMPCAVTQDARRFIGVDPAGKLLMPASITVAKAVQDHIQRGVVDYNQFVIRTGVSITSLEVDVRGDGFKLFDCGRPAVPSAPTPAPTTTVPAQTQATGGR